MRTIITAELDRTNYTYKVRIMKNGKLLNTIDSISSDDLDAVAAVVTSAAVRYSPAVVVVPAKIKALLPEEIR